MAVQPDEVDLQLVNILQGAPRAAWVDVANIVGISPSAAANRWRRLENDGAAWVGLQPTSVVGRPVTAMMMVSIKEQNWGRTVAELYRDPRIVGVDEVSGAVRLLLTIMVNTLDELRVFTNELATRRKVRVGSVHHITQVLRQGMDWRLDALTPTQVAAVEKLGRETTPAPGPKIGPLPTDADEIIEVLSRDGRSSTADIARVIERDPSTTGRHLREVMRSNVLQFRCDCANELFGWPVTSFWFLKIPQPDFDAYTKALLGLRQLRLALGVTGDINLIFWMYHRSLAGVSQAQRALGQLMPRADVVESMIQLRSRKRMGWLIDDTGRRSGEYIRPAVLSGLGS